jgi:hypothetical protein
MHMSEATQNSQQPKSGRSKFLRVNLASLEELDSGM